MALFSSTTLAHCTLLTVTIALLTGCSSTSNRKDATAAGFTSSIREANDRIYQKNNSQLLHTTVTEGFYVPRVTYKEYMEPDWWNINLTNFQSKGLPLENLMESIASDYGIQYKFAPKTPRNTKVSISHKGTIGGLLEKISNTTELSFSVENGVVIWKKFISRNYEISFLPGITKFKTGLINSTQENYNIENTKNGSNDDSLHTQSASINLWSELEKQLRNLTSSEAKISISAATGTVYITDTKSKITEISNYINSLNKQITQQVSIDVEIIEVRLNNGRQYGINWNLVKEASSGDGLINLISPFSSTAQNGSIPTVLNLQVTGEGSQYNGSNVLVKALKEQGEVSIVTSPRVVTMNNQVAEIALTRQHTYLASSTSRTTPNVGFETTLTPGVVTSGLKLFTLPKIQDNKIILQMNGSLSALLSIDRVESNGSLIETPSLNEKRISQRAIVSHGETLLLTGFKDVRRENSKKSTLGQILLGGEVNKSQESTEVIILITPRIMGTNT